MNVALSMKREPSRSLAAEAERLLDSAAVLRLGTRLLAALAFWGVAALFIVLAVIVSSMHHWAASIVLVVVVDPLAVFLTLAGCSVLSPRGTLARWFTSIFSRSLWIMVLILCCVAVAGLVPLALEVWHSLHVVE